MLHLPLRIPQSHSEARAFFDRWSALNGRYYIRADIVLSDGTFITDATFDGDSGVAIEFNSCWVYDLPLYLGKQVVDALIIEKTGGGQRIVATTEERLKFHERYRELSIKLSGERTSSPGA